MNNDIIKNIPKYIAKVASEIFIITDDILKVIYDGEKVKYKKVSDCKYKDIDSDTIINNKKIFVFAEGNCKIIIVIEINEVKEESSKKTIMIADDSDLIIKFFKNIFESDYNIVSASNGLEVVDYIEDGNSIDALVLDLMMPVSSGFQVLDYFEKNNLFSKIPTVIISGDDSKDVIDRAMKYQVIDMLQKPFSVNDAKNLINKVLK